MKTNIENIPAELKIFDQWVNAYDDSKCPIDCWNGLAASSTNPKTWSDWNTAIKGSGDYVGFVFHNPTPYSGVVGIDIDKCFDENRNLKGAAQDIMTLCSSYAEISKSGKGLHILCKGCLPFSGKNNLQGVEIYRDKRYFILTGNKIGDCSSINDGQALINYILKEYFQEAEPHRKTYSKNRGGPMYKLKYPPMKDGKISLIPKYPPVNEGGRHMAMVSLAGQYRAIGMNPSQILKEIAKANKSACNPPLELSELKSIAQSMAKYSN